MTREIKFIIYTSLIFMFIGVCFGLSNLKKDQYEILYKSGEKDLEEFPLFLRNTLSGEYETILVSSDSEIQYLFNEYRNSLPLNYYIGNYSNYHLGYYRNINGVIDCVIQNFDGDVEVFSKCYVNSLLLNGARKINLRINDVLYVYDTFI